uniref:Uncharacterized protein n=1 Tax=Physcomitrium patens TaxID=3218 RepID=A0A2K1JQS2_PHYPA|nr:hypothetical protein PHYPA_016270 [Physcomitrium patens]
MGIGSVVVSTIDGNIFAGASILLDSEQAQMPTAEVTFSKGTPRGPASNRSPPSTATAYKPKTAPLRANPLESEVAHFRPPARCKSDWAPNTPHSIGSHPPLPGNTPILEDPCTSAPYSRCAYRIQIHLGQRPDSAPISKEKNRHYRPPRP